MDKWFLCQYSRSIWEQGCYKKICRESRSGIQAEACGAASLVVADTSELAPGAFILTQNFDSMVTSLEASSISVDGLFLNADAGFDTVSFRNCLFKHDIFDNIDSNKRNGKNDVSFLDEALYIQSFVVERTNAWQDAFKAI